MEESACSFYSDSHVTNYSHVEGLCEQSDDELLTCYLYLDAASSWKAPALPVERERVRLSRQLHTLTVDSHSEGAKTPIYWLHLFYKRNESQVFPPLIMGLQVGRAKAEWVCHLCFTTLWLMARHMRQRDRPVGSCTPWNPPSSEILPDRWYHWGCVTCIHYSYGLRSTKWVHTRMDSDWFHGTWIVFQQFSGGSWLQAWKRELHYQTISTDASQTGWGVIWWGNPVWRQWGGL